jgi:hypothetical protein
LLLVVKECKECILSFCFFIMTVFLTHSGGWHGSLDQAPDLATVLAVLPTKFHERWCGGPIARELASGEMDAILVYNPFEAAGEAMAASAKAAIVGTSGQEEVSSVPEFNVVPPVASASQIRAALLVKLFANLFCYNPEVCAGACLVFRIG